MSACESICSGDRGGPAFVAPSGAIVGVVSRGGNGLQPTQDAGAIACVDSSGAAGTFCARNIYTQVAPFKDFILSGFEAAGHTPWLEGAADPRLTPFGGTCKADTECQGNVCVLASDTGACSQSCDTETSPCPDGFDCSAASGASICVVKAPPPASNGASASTSTGCSSTSTHTGDGPLYVGLFFATFAIGGAVRRARRRAR